ncbi:MAG: HAD family hydrolase [Ruminococcaceae bacterium]|nr:HAD family hydrolase [Oscillospiraceae bacterium]
MKPISTVLFDLDGTLLPMDHEKFMHAYFGGLAARLAPRGYEPKTLIDAIWAGTAAMVKNDGSCRNEEAFWNRFTSILGERAREDMPHFDAFYREDFDKAALSCGRAPEAREIIDRLHARGIRTVLATNPLFPAIATEKRTRWAGLDPSDFALITTYENSTHCKPNPDYYRDILARIGADPQECLMVGNDVGEDMIAATLGMRVFLLTDCLINRKNADISQYPHGSFAELKAFLETL